LGRPEAEQVTGHPGMGNDDAPQNALGQQSQGSTLFRSWLAAFNSKRLLYRYTAQMAIFCYRQSALPNRQVWESTAGLIGMFGSNTSGLTHLGWEEGRYIFALAFWQKKVRATCFGKRLTKLSEVALEKGFVTWLHPGAAPLQ